MPTVELDDLISQLLLSKEQAERGDTRPADEIFAELQEQFRRHVVMAEI